MSARLVGVVHLPPLPGSPRATMAVREIARRAADDAMALEAAGFDFVIVENFGDVPFFRGRVPAITVSAMTACAIAVREKAPKLGVGINVLRNDADAALAVACAAGGACIRVNVHTGARVTDQGIIEGDAAATLRARRALGVEHVAIWADVDVKHSAPIAPRDVAHEASDLVARGMADALLVTGAGTGHAVDLATLDAVRAAAPATAVLVASGATVAQLSALAGRCDGVIVGSALREDGVAGGPVDRARAQAFADAFRHLFGGDAA